MAKHSHLAKYFADDKDILDLMSTSRMTKTKLHEFARSRGIFVSPEEPIQKLIAYLHTLPCCREQLIELLAVIDSEDREEKVTSRKIESDVDISTLSAACGALRDDRASSKGESYVINQYTDTHMQLQVKYADLDHNRTRLLQRRDRDLTIELEIVNGRIETRYPDNSRAAEIVKALVKNLSNDKQQEPPLKAVCLSGIRIPKLRNDFFIGMMEGVKGYELSDVVDVKVDRLVSDPVPGNEDSEGDDDDEVIEAEKEQMQSELKKVVLTGKGLLYSPEYQRLISSNFFISRASWLSCQSSGMETSVEFVAEFRDADAGEGFCYNIRGIWRKNEDGETKSTKSRPTQLERLSLLRLLEDSAEDSLGEVMSSITPTAQDEGTII